MTLRKTQTHRLPTGEREIAIGGHVAGIDEAGRGCLAGPVCAAAVILPPHLLTEDLGFRDSKLLSAKKRAVLAQLIQREAQVGIALVSSQDIDRINILNAAMRAMAKAVAALPSPPDHCLIDGNRVPGELACPATAVIGGDRLCFSIAAASIIAKTHRDALMQQLHKAYPAYEWARNAGYGTRAHLKALELVGPSPHHRRSFKPLRQ
ncbi:MAG: ribonuclease HII [Pseudomonadota bacterium]